MRDIILKKMVWTKTNTFISYSEFKLREQPNKKYETKNETKRNEQLIQFI